MEILSTTIKGLFQNQKGKILIAKSVRDEFWELPGGKIEYGEQPEETLRREAKEEFGIEHFEILRLFGAFSFLATDEEGDWQFNVIVYLCKMAESQLSVSAEHEEYKWILPTEAHNFPMREGYYRLIEKIK